MIVAGFDEAGYGPKLGPLVVAWTAFRVPDAPAAPDLWKELGAAVRSEGSGPATKLWIADSKAVRPRADGLRQLELATLAFLRAASGWRLGTAGELLLSLGNDPGRYAAAAWYEGLVSTPLPAFGWDGEVAAHAARLAGAGRAKGIEAVGALAQALPEWEFNEGVRALASKGRVLFAAFGPLLEALRATFPGEPIVVAADKHGGRDYYGELLRLVFPRTRVEVEAEGPRLSSYRLATRRGPLSIHFQPEAEAASLPVALASMTCKYVRELFMVRLNAWFRARLPGLRPTAGYPQDADRFLRDAEPALAGIPLERLVRAR